MAPLDRWAEDAVAQQAANRLQRRPGDKPLRRSQEALLRQRIYPSRHHGWICPQAPGQDVAFLTVANDRFFRGLEALLLSLLAVYPELNSPFHVLHDGSLIPFLQRRLERIYPHLIFQTPKPPWWETPAGDSYNQRRIGMLGYLNTYAFRLAGYRRLIVLDSDLLVIGALDPLWAPGDAVRAVADCGELPYVAISPATHKPVINSGVLSLPGSILGPQSAQLMDELIGRRADPFCPLLDSFADQKVWNQFLANQDVELMPINYNCNVKYLARYLDGLYEGLSVLHYAGAKPWLEPPWVAASHNPPQVSTAPFVAQQLLWNQLYRQFLHRERLRQYRRLDAEPLPASGSLCHLQVVTDPRHALPADGGPIHLVLEDPTLLGDQWPQQPQLPAPWIPPLVSLGTSSGVILWAAYELEPSLCRLQLPEGVRCRYVLVEAPFSPPLEQGLDLISLDPGGYQPISSPPALGLILAVIRRCTLACD